MTKEVTLETVLSSENLKQAFKAVKRNGGSGGLDGRSIEQTQTYLRSHWQQVYFQLYNQRYCPTPVREVLIPKAGGGHRRLGIPTVQDRMIQQAIQQELSELFEPTFSRHSYGYRPGRNAHDALLSAQRYVRGGKEWVIDLDLDAFFDRINHDLMTYRLREQVSDPKLLRLVRRFMKAGMAHPKGIYDGHQGTPQGSPLSPLLANIYLTPLDLELERRGLRFCRYADDIQIYVGSERSAQRVYEGICRWIRTHLKLEINPTKSGIGRVHERQYLGYRITIEGELEVDASRVERYKDKVRALWRANQSLTSIALVKQWRRFVLGWGEYFRLGRVSKDIRYLSSWTRRHMRKCFWLRWHNRQGRQNALRRLGLRGRWLSSAGSGRGAWRLASSPAIHKALSNARLRRHGLLTAEDLLGR